MVSEARNRTKKVLDHGYVTLIETWGSDERVIESARMSTSGAFKGWGPKPCSNDECQNGLEPRGGAMQDCLTCKGKGELAGDEKLLATLYNNHHMTPFEMAGLTFEVQAPIFVFREWHRHRTQSYNEMSGRYIELPELCYAPSDERIAHGKQSKTNRQGSQEFGEDETMVRPTVRTAFAEVYRIAWAHYQEMLQLGVARELASRVLPVSQYSRMRASADLRNWLGFLTLRMDQTAQWEIRQYANAVADMIAENFPRTWALFNVTGPVISSK